jgi:uncharacterized protein (DUF169 family)
MTGTHTAFDWQALVADLNRYLRLRTTVIGMKLFETVETMAAVPRIRRPDRQHTADQIVGQAARLNWTVGVTAEDLVGTQCAGILGLIPQDDAFMAGESYVGVWWATAEDAAEHQRVMNVVPAGRYRAMAVSPLASGRLDPPDICLIYATPAQMILLINGLQWTGYRKLDFSCVGESACADSWGRALATGEPSVSIPCYAERRYGGVMEDELLMALPPKFLPQILAGLERLSANGLRYPIPAYGIQADAREGLGFSYGAARS